MNLQETQIYCEEQRKLAMQLGIPIYTAVQPKREVAVEMCNLRESLEFVEKMKFATEIVEISR
jgi:hypothetical protein